MVNHPVLPVELLKGDEEVKTEAVDNFVKRIQREWDHAKRNLLQSVQKTAVVLQSETSNGRI